MGQNFVRLCAILMSMVLGSCGGGGAGDTGGPSSSGHVIYGRVLSGAPVPGEVTVLANGQSVTATVNASGTFSALMSGPGPYKLRAQSTNRTLELYSYSVSDGYVNVNPMTTAILYNATKVDPPAFFLGERQLSSAELAQAEQQLQALLGKTLLQYGVTPGTASFFTTPFEPNRFGLDGVLDAVQVAVSSTGVVVFPIEGTPIDLSATNVPYLATSDEVQVASVWSKIGNSVLSWNAGDTFEVTKTAIDLLETRDDLHIYLDADGGSVFVLNGIAKSVLKAKLVEAMKVVLLDRLAATSLITTDEERFLNTLNEATFGAFFLQPYLNIAAGKTATNGLEVQLLEEFNRTRPGRWLLDPVKASKDLRPVISWLSACPLPTRIYESLLSWFPAWTDSQSSCSVPNTPPTASLQVGPNPAIEGNVVSLDASGSSDAESSDLAFAWALQVVEGSGDIVLVDRYRAQAYLYATRISVDSRILVTLTVSDPAGTVVSRSTTLLITKAPQPVPSVSLRLSSSTIALGESASIQWSSTDATSCTADGAWTGSKLTSGTEAVSPSLGQHTYRLNCSGPGGSAAASETLTVSAPPPAPVVNISVTPASILSGTSSTLTWSASNATSCTASGSWSGSRTVSGTQVVSPGPGNYVYTLICTGAGGTASGSASLSVTVPPVPAVTLTATPADVVAGGSSTLNWSATNALSCTASGAWAGGKSVNGAEVVTPPVGANTFSLACTGPGGTASVSATVTVTAAVAAPVVSISAAPASIAVGASSTLAWSASDATGCSASGAWSGAKPATGSLSVSPAAGSYSYTLTCSGPGGTVAATATLLVGGCSAEQLASNTACADADWPALKLDEPFSSLSAFIYNPLSGIDGNKARIVSGVLQLGSAGTFGGYSLSTNFGRYFGGSKIVLVARMRAPTSGNLRFALVNSGGEFGFGIRDCGTQLKPFIYGGAGYAPSAVSYAACPSLIEFSGEKTQFFGADTTAYGVYKFVVDGAQVRIERFDEVTRETAVATVTLMAPLITSSAFYLRISGLGPAEIDWFKMYSE